METNLHLIAQSYIASYVIVLLMFTVSILAIAVTSRRRISYKTDLEAKKKKKR